MRKIELASEPSQQFSVSLNDNNFDIRIKDVGGLCLMDIKVNEETLALGLPVYPNQPIIPYAYKSRYGNFVYFTATEEYPEWKTLNKQGNLFYLSPEEVQEIING